MCDYSLHTVLNRGLQKLGDKPTYARLWHRDAKASLHRKTLA